MILLMDFVD